MEVDEDTIMHDSAADGDAADTVVVDRVPRVSPPAAEPAAAAGGASAMDVDAVADQERERDRDEEVAVTTENAATVSSVGEPSHAEPAAVDTQEGEAGEAKSESAKAPARKKRLTPAAMLRAALAEKIFLPAGMYSEYYKLEPSLRPVVREPEAGADGDEAEDSSEEDDEGEGADVVDESEDESEAEDDNQPPYSLADFGALRLPIYNGIPMLGDQKGFQLPFDIWAKHTVSKTSGAPPKPKLVPFKKITRSTFADGVGALMKMQEVTACECKLPANADEPACGADCLNRVMFIECNNQCPCGDRCTNRRIQRREYSRQLRRVRTPKKGYGIVAKTALDKGTFILEYVGDVIPLETYVERVSSIYSRHEHYYCLQLNGALVIDAGLRGGEARFINHSCDPNCHVEKWNVNGEWRVGIFAMRDIQPGEELTYDYNYQSFRSDTVCHCGAANCRGFIRGKAKTEEVVGPDGEVRRVDSSRAKAKRLTKDDRLFCGVLWQKGEDMNPEDEKLSLKEQQFIRRRRLFLLRQQPHKAETIKVDGKQLDLAEFAVAFQARFQHLKSLKKAGNDGGKTAVRTRCAELPSAVNLDDRVELALLLDDLVSQWLDYKTARGVHVAAPFAHLSARDRSKAGATSSKKCCDFDQLRQHVRSGAYATAEEFWHGLTHVWQSAIKLYPKDHTLHKAAITLRQIVQSHFRPALDHALSTLEQEKRAQEMLEIETIQQAAENGERIACLCGQYDAYGETVTCSRCKTLQHCACLRAAGLFCETEGDSYVCCSCEERPYNREIMIKDQESKLVNSENVAASKQALQQLKEEADKAGAEHKDAAKELAAMQEKAAAVKTNVKVMRTALTKLEQRIRAIGGGQASVRRRSKVAKPNAAVAGKTGDAIPVNAGAPLSELQIDAVSHSQQPEDEDTVMVQPMATTTAAATTTITDSSSNNSGTSSPRENRALSEVSPGSIEQTPTPDTTLLPASRALPVAATPIATELDEGSQKLLVELTTQSTDLATRLKAAEAESETVKELLAKMGELVNEKSALSQQAKTAYKAALKSFGDADKIFYRTLLLRDGQTLLRMGDCVVAEIKSEASMPELTRVVRPTALWKTLEGAAWLSGTLYLRLGEAPARRGFELAAQEVVRTEISVDLPLENIQSICHVLPYAVYTLGAPKHADKSNVFFCQNRYHVAKDLWDSHSEEWPSAALHPSIFAFHGRSGAQHQPGRAGAVDRQSPTKRTTADVRAAQESAELLEDEGAEPKRKRSASRKDSGKAAGRYAKANGPGHRLATVARRLAEKSGWRPSETDQALLHQRDSASLQPKGSKNGKGSRTSDQ